MRRNPKPHPPREPIDVYLYDPSREPAWRFQVTLEILAKHPRSMPADIIADDPIRKFYKFLRLYRMLEADARPQLRVMSRGLYDAFEIYEAADTRLRLNVECRLLAGQTDDEIAAKVHLSPEVVSAYEPMFFDVRRALQATDWVSRQVLRPALEGKLSQDEFLLKRFAYTDGPRVFEHMLALSQVAKRPRNLAEIEALCEQDPVNRDWYEAQLLVEIERLPFEQQLAMRLAQLEHPLRLDGMPTEESVRLGAVHAEAFRKIMSDLDKFKARVQKLEDAQE